MTDQVDPRPLCFGKFNLDKQSCDSHMRGRCDEATRRNRDSPCVPTNPYGNISTCDLVDILAHRASVTKYRVLPYNVYTIAWSSRNVNSLPREYHTDAGPVEILVVKE